MPPPRKYKIAFTLAEVLITLGIIGVVAAMTMPTLIENQRDKEIVSRLQKTYAILSQALLYAQNENGDASSWNIIDNNSASTREIFSYFEPYLKIIRKCDDKSGCWAEQTKSLSGQTAQWSGNLYLGVNYLNITLADGTNISFDLCSTRYAYFGLPSDIQSFVLFYVDVNGNKNPNTLGRDIFAFAVYKNKLVPFGIGNDSQNCSKTINNNTSGYGCTYRVLQEKAINY